MSQSQTSSRAASSPRQQQQQRPWNGLWILTMVALSIGGLYVMRIDGAVAGYPVDFEEAVNAAQFPNGRGPMQTRYLGFSGVDYLLRFIVAAFTPGAAAWDPAYILHHLHFFFNFTAVLGIWVVEANREGNKGRVLSYTTLFAICYQTIGAAPFIPLWYLFHLLSSSKSPSSSSSTLIPLPTARALLPATILGYVLPTLCMYIPWTTTTASPSSSSSSPSFSLTPSAIALWQPSPLYVNLLLFVFSSAPGPGAENQWVRPQEKKELEEKKQGKDGKIGDEEKQVRSLLKSYYRALMTIGIISHAGVLYVAVASPSSPFLASSSSSSSPSSSSLLSSFLSRPSSSESIASILGALGRIFLPDPARKMESFAEGLHYIFQWDWLVVVVASLIWCYVSVLDVLRVRGSSGGKIGIGKMGKVAGLMLLGTVCLGPGATMALVWIWREDKLPDVLREGKGKPKTS